MGPQSGCCALRTSHRWWTCHVCCNTGIHNFDDTPHCTKSELVAASYFPNSLVSKLLMILLWFFFFTEKSFAELQTNGLPSSGRTPGTAASPSRKRLSCQISTSDGRATYTPMKMDFILRTKMVIRYTYTSKWLGFDSLICCQYSIRSNSIGIVLR